MSWSHPNGVRPFEILNDKLCPIDTMMMKDDQMPVKGDVLRNYLLLLLWVLSSLYMYLNQQPPVAFNQEVKRHKFTCKCG